MANREKSEAENLPLAEQHKEQIWSLPEKKKIISDMDRACNQTACGVERKKITPHSETITCEM
jgi:hypothetical protein